MGHIHSWLRGFLGEYLITLELLSSLLRLLSPSFSFLNLVLHVFLMVDIGADDSAVWIVGLILIKLLLLPFRHTPQPIGLRTKRLYLLGNRSMITNSMIQTIQLEFLLMLSPVISDELLDRLLIGVVGLLSNTVISVHFANFLTVEKVVHPFHVVFFFSPNRRSGVFYVCSFFDSGETISGLHGSGSSWITFFDRYGCL